MAAGWRKAGFWRSEEARDEYDSDGQDMDPAEMLLTSYITTDFAEHIINRRRADEEGVRILRVALLRTRLPVEICRVVEAFALTPARDAVPCRREELPAFIRHPAQREERRLPARLPDA